MDAATELRMLRARAYGPDADIADDPVALARLTELEDLRAAPPLPPPPPVPPAETTVAPPAAAEEPETARSESDVAPPVAADRPGRPRWLVPVWAGSIVAALILGGFAGGTAMRWVHRSGGAEQVASLQQEAPSSIPALFGNELEAVTYQDFFGFTAVLPPEGTWTGQGDTDCLLVMQTQSLRNATNGVSGSIFSDCAAGAFPAAVQFVVDASAPAEFRERFAEGTAVQFVYDGDAVGVFVGTE